MIIPRGHRESTRLWVHISPRLSSADGDSVSERILVDFDVALNITELTKDAEDGSAVLTPSGLLLAEMEGRACAASAKINKTKNIVNRIF